MGELREDTHSIHSRDDDLRRSATTSGPTPSVGLSTDLLPARFNVAQEGVTGMRPETGISRPWGSNTVKRPAGGVHWVFCAMVGSSTGDQAYCTSTSRLRSRIYLPSLYFWEAS